MIKLTCMGVALFILSVSGRDTCGLGYYCETGNCCGLMFCCSAGKKCCNPGCCDPDTTCCGRYCCPSGSKCCGNHCCLGSATCCGSGCCVSGMKCCQGQCKYSCEVPCRSSIPNGQITRASDCRPIDGDKCSYTCDAGYTADLFLKTLTCEVSGSWDVYTSRLCQPIKCPYGIRNGYLKSACNRRPNDTCTYNCNEGYQFSSLNRTLLCGDNGKWNIDTNVLCEAKPCPANLPNGNLSDSCSKQQGQTCPYICDEGYRQINAEAMCSFPGKWNGENSLCEEIFCPGSIANGFLTSSCSLKPSHSCSVNCQKGYNATVDDITCMANGSWNQDITDICRPKPCPANLPNGNLSDSCSKQQGQTCPYICDEGYRQINAEAMCSFPGKWNGENSLCEEIFCPGSIANGFLTSSCSLKPSHSCSVNCQKGYNATVDDITCMANGSWNQDITDMCRRPCSPTIPNGDVTVSTSCRPLAGEACSYKCDNGFSAAHAQISCRRDGEWVENTLNMCTSDSGDQCPYIIQHGALDSMCTRRPNDTCSFGCDSGYRSTEQEVTCGSRNEWNRDVDTLCNEILCPKTILNGNVSIYCTRLPGVTCSYKCVDGHKPSIETVLCLADGTWQEDTRACIYVGICPPPQVENGEIIGVCQNEQGSTCDIRCNKGFGSKEWPVLSCGKSREWRQNFNCTAVSRASSGMSTKTTVLTGIVSYLVLLAINNMR